MITITRSLHIPSYIRSVLKVFLAHLNIYGNYQEQVIYKISKFTDQTIKISNQTLSVVMITILYRSPFLAQLTQHQRRFQLIWLMNRVFLSRHHAATQPNRVALPFFVGQLILFTLCAVVRGQLSLGHLVTWLNFECFECNFQFEVTLNIYYNVIFTSHLPWCHANYNNNTRVAATAAPFNFASHLLPNLRKCRCRYHVNLVEH